MNHPGWCEFWLCKRTTTYLLSSPILQLQPWALMNFIILLPPWLLPLQHYQTSQTYLAHTQVSDRSSGQVLTQCISFIHPSPAGAIWRWWLSYLHSVMAQSKDGYFDSEKRGGSVESLRSDNYKLGLLEPTPPN